MRGRDRESSKICNALFYNDTNNCFGQQNMKVRRTKGVALLTIFGEKMISSPIAATWE